MAGVLLLVFPIHDTETKIVPYLFVPEDWHVSLGIVVYVRIMLSCQI